jgi:hypothetical protein
MKLFALILAAFVLFVGVDAHAAIGVASHVSAHAHSSGAFGFLKVLGPILVLGMNLTGTGFNVWPLTTGNNDDPSLTPGKPTSFNCNTVPDRCASGPLANYMPGIEVTFSGTVLQAGGGGANIFSDRFAGALFDSFDWIQCWHGNQVSANFVKGVDWYPIEYNSMGFRHPLRVPSLIAASSNGAYNFDFTVFVPACSGFGRLFNDTMQLAILFRNSQLKVNAAPAAVLANMSPGATMTGPGGAGTVTARASAVLVPRQDLVLGPAVEWVLTQIVAGTSSPQVQIKGFGTDTQMQGVEPGGGVITLMELTNVLDQGGVFAAENAQQYQFPWRNQQVTQHPQAIVSQVISGMPNDRPHNFAPAIASQSDFLGYPYTQDITRSVGDSALDLRNLYGWIMAQGANNLDLTQLQTADTDQSYFLTVNGGFSAGSHQILGQFARSWQESMIQNWIGQVTAGGSASLAQYVLGKYTGLKRAQRTPRTQHVITNDQLRYLPIQLY